MLSKEKKAIKVLEQYKKECIEEYELEINNVEENIDQQHASYLHQQIEATEIVLNLITKLQKEKKRLESVKNMYDIHKHVYQKQWLDEREINSEKDKIINLMKEYFVGLTVWDKEKDEPLILGDKKEVEQFFNKLAKEEGENNANNM